MRFGSRGPSLRYVTEVNWRRRPGKRRTRTRRSLEQGIQFHYSVSWTGCLSGPDALNRVWTLVVLSTCLVCSVFYNCKSSFTPNKRNRKLMTSLEHMLKKDCHTCFFSWSRIFKISSNGSTALSSVVPMMLITLITGIWFFNFSFRTSSNTDNEK